MSVVVYGATGYTGRQIARDAVRRGLPVIVAGRTERKLHALARELEGEVDVRVASLDDAAGLTALAREARVVVNCAGPFAHTAVPVVDATIAGGAHYIDISAEQLGVKPVYDRDAAARDAGVALLPSAAIFGGPAGLVAAAALGRGAPAGDVEVLWAVKGWRPSWTTVAARLEGMRSSWWVWEDGGPSERRGWPATELRDFGPPLGRRRVGVYPTPDAFAVPRAIRAERVRTLMTTSTISPLGPVLPLFANAASALMRTPARPVVERALALSWGSTGEDAKTSDPTPFTIALRVDGSIVARVSGRGIYDLTSPIAVEAAARVLDPSFDRTGALALAEAFDPVSFLDALAPRGVRYELRNAASSSNRASGSSSASPSSSRSRVIR